MVNGRANAALRQVARVFHEGTLAGLSDRLILGVCPSIAFSRRHSNNPVTLGIRSPDLARFYDEQDLSRMGPRPNLHVSALTSGLAA